VDISHTSPPLTLSNRQDEPWRVIDTSFKASDIFSTIKEKFATLSYTRPDKEIVFSAREDPTREGTPKLGASVIQLLNKWIDGGIRLRGGTSNGLSFLFFYELLTGSLSLRILTSDRPAALAFFLIQLFPAEDSMTNSLLMSILRILCNNPLLCFDPNLPKYEETRSFGVASLFSSQTVHAEFLSKVTQFLIEREAKVRFSLSPFVSMGNNFDSDNMAMSRR
jgi:hypothetical protein